MEVGEEEVDPLEVVHLEVVALVGVVAGPLDHLDQDQAQVAVEVAAGPQDLLAPVQVDPPDQVQVVVGSHLEPK